MREQSQSHYVGLDIGSSAVRCVVGMADRDEPGNLSIIGHGSQTNLGMRKGIIVHVDDVAHAISEAVLEAERVSGVRIESATININGSHVLGMNSRGVIAISAANREITPEDRLRVEEAATIVKLPANREIIQVFAKNYRVDGQDNIKNPVDMQGVRLEVDTHIVTAATPNIRNLELAVDKANLSINHRTISSLAAAEAVLTRQQKEAGSVLLDIGAGSTNMVVIEDGEVQHVAVIPMGGTNITNDLAIGLKTDLDIAEAVKVQHANLSSKPKTKSAGVTIEGKSHYFDSEDIHMITEARVDELFDFVDKELRKIGKARKLPGGVVIVGGTAKLPGIEEFAKEKLQLAARKGSLQPINGLQDTVDDVQYFTAVGLMLLDLLLMPAPTREQGQPNQSAFRLIEGLIKRFKG